MKIYVKSLWSINIQYISKEKLSLASLKKGLHKFKVNIIYESQKNAGNEYDTLLEHSLLVEKKERIKGRLNEKKIMKIIEIILSYIDKSSKCIDKIFKVDSEQEFDQFGIDLSDKFISFLGTRDFSFSLTGRFTACEDS